MEKSKDNSLKIKIKGTYSASEKRYMATKAIIWSFLDSLENGTRKEFSYTQLENCIKKYGYTIRLGTCVTPMDYLNSMAENNKIEVFGKDGDVWIRIK